MINYPIHVIIVDDHPLFRIGLKASLNTSDHKIEVIGEAESGDELDCILSNCVPDVILLDILLPGESGIDIARRLRKSNPTIKLLILSAEGSKESIKQLMTIGIDGFVGKSVPEYELRTAIEYVADGGEYFGRDIARIMHCIIAAKATEKDDGLFTAREKDIINLCCDGKSAKEIADELNISLKTVIAHKYNIFQKIGIHSATELIAYSIRNGIVTL
jgi:two-component system response regulator NreC